jgi:hypothetical protein
MRYLLQRVVHNDLRWKRPSIGRRGSTVDPGYPAEHGFGYEDWQFSSDVARDGMIHGYTYFRPKDPNESFNIGFVTYDKGGIWSLAGFYNKATFQENGPLYSDTVLRSRAKELLELEAAGDLGGRYENIGHVRLIELLRAETRAHYHWSVRSANVHSFWRPVLKQVPPPQSRRSAAVYDPNLTQT